MENHYQKKGILEIISRIEFILLYKSEYLTSAQKKNWEKALQLLYKAEKLISEEPDEMHKTIHSED